LTWATVYIGLGSNIEPRRKYIERALNLLAGSEHTRVAGVSSIYETTPQGDQLDQGRFLNGVVCIETDLLPDELLDALEAIEQELGRRRTARWGPRTIDLDILLYGQQIICTDRLTIPHALMHERRFVIQGLAEIAPEALHPILQMTAKTILESLGDEL